MFKPAHSKERGRKSQGGVIGIDEVGRGPLAGPVTVCAFYIPDKRANKEIQNLIFGNTIKDSKRLSKDCRHNVYRTVRFNRMLIENSKYAISSRSASYIDKYGISVAVTSCIRSCINSLIKQGVNIRNVQFNLDAGLKVPVEGVKQQSVIKGDEKYVEIALASIMAKVSRDSYMKRLSTAHTEYKWNENAGYGTKHHCEAIRRIGITKHHRKTYLKAF